MYYDGDSGAASRLLLLEGGLYANDWSAFGAFVAAPFGGLLWAAAACALRIAALWVWARVRGTRFEALDRPVPRRPGGFENEEVDAVPVLAESVQAGKSGKFF